MTPRPAASSFRAACCWLGSLYVFLAAAAPAYAQQPGANPQPGGPRPGVRVMQPPPGAAAPASNGPVAPPAMQVPPNSVAPAAATTPPPPATAPFVLSPAEQQELNALLLNWQNHGAKVKTLHCSFYLWETNPTFNDNTQHAGQIKYEYPDRGEYSVDQIAVRGPDGQGVKWQPDPKERWSCNGEAVFQFDAKQKLVVKHELPANLRGVAIQQSPLPFLFSANAQHLSARYFMRIITKPEDKAKGHIWIEAYPRYQQDAANFKRAELILTANDFLPYGLKLVLPDGGAQGREHEKSYLFADYKINPSPGFFSQLLGGRKIGDPEIPAGWQTRVEAATEPATAPTASQTPKPLSIFRPKG